MPSEKPRSTILLIDDEGDLRKLVTFNLEREGFRVLTAENGAVGLGMIRVEHPDVIILDVVMPAMDGHEVLRQLKADPVTRDIPVIVLTALGADRDVSTSLHLGAVYHMGKPYRYKELIDEIKLAMWKRQPTNSQPSA